MYQKTPLCLIYYFTRIMQTLYASPGLKNSVSPIRSKTIKMRIIQSNDGENTIGDRFSDQRSFQMEIVPRAIFHDLFKKKQIVDYSAL